MAKGDFAKKYWEYVKDAKRDNQPYLSMKEYALQYNQVKKEGEQNGSAILQSTESNS